MSGVTANEKSKETAKQSYSTLKHDFSLSTLTKLADGFGSKSNPTLTKKFVCEGFTPEIGSPASKYRIKR
jgi:hypothetical protein